MSAPPPRANESDLGDVSSVKRLVRARLARGASRGSDIFDGSYPKRNYRAIKGVARAGQTAA